MQGEKSNIEARLATKHLCVVGNINRDIKTSPIKSGENLLLDGETAVESIIETMGGGGANSACAARALGAQVTFIGRVGDDPLGARLESRMNELGIHTRLAKSPDHATGTTVNLNYQNGERHFLSSLPNNRALSADDLQVPVSETIHHLYRADIWFSEAMLFGGNQRLFEQARRLRIPISLDLNWDPSWGVAEEETVEKRKEAVRTLLPYVDIVHGNARELEHFAGGKTLEKTLEKLTEWGAKAVITHLGEQGAGYYGGGRFEVAPAAPVRDYINTTGTGDVLTVCMMLLHDEKLPVTEKLAFANNVVSEFISGERELIPKL